MAPSPWAWHPHPEVWAVMLASMLAYLLALVRWGPSSVGRGQPVATRRQVVAFASGVSLLWLSADWPVHDLAERYLYSAHMVQHQLMIMPAPPLLLMGMPDWLIRRLLSWRAGSFHPLGTLAQGASRPLVAGLVFNTSIVVFHVPAVVNFTLVHHGAHFLAHAVMFSAAMVMWFPVMNRLPECGLMSYPSKFLYLFIMTVMPNLPVAFLTLATGVVYQYYAHVPRPFPISAVEDQQLAAAIMKVTGTAFYLTVAAVMFFRWARQENDDTDRALLRDDEPLTWDDIRRQLERSAQPEFGVRRST